MSRGPDVYGPGREYRVAEGYTSVPREGPSFSISHLNVWCRQSSWFSARVPLDRGSVLQTRVKSLSFLLLQEEEADVSVNEMQTSLRLPSADVPDTYVTEGWGCGTGLSGPFQSPGRSHAMG